MSSSFKVEHLTDLKLKNRKIYVKIKWVNYKKESWEEIENISNGLEILLGDLLLKVKKNPFGYKNPKFIKNYIKRKIAKKKKSIEIINISLNSLENDLEKSNNNLIENSIKIKKLNKEENNIENNSVNNIDNKNIFSFNSFSKETSNIKLKEEEKSKEDKILIKEEELKENEELKNIIKNSNIKNFNIFNYNKDLKTDKFILNGLELKNNELFCKINILKNNVTHIISLKELFKKNKKLAISFLKRKFCQLHKLKLMDLEIKQFIFN